VAAGSGADGRQATGGGRAARVAALGLAVAAAMASASGVAADGVLLRVQQGTDLTVAAAPEGTLVIDLAGRLWRIPRDGGTATPITPPGEIARHPAFAPGGGALAWQALRDGRFQLVVAGADGAAPRTVTRGDANHITPAWSPDGKRLALASDRGGDYGIWTLDPASGALAQVSFDAGDEFDPTWAPDGATLAWASEHAGRYALVTRAASGAQRTLVANGRMLRAPSWRPDGSVIAYTAAEPRGPRLSMVILSDPPVVKPLANGEAIGTGPVAWVDRQQMVYAADGGIRRREFGALSSVAVPFEAALQVRPAAAAAPRALPRAAENQSVRGLAGIAVLPDGRVVASALGDLWEFSPDGALLRALTQDAYVDRDPAASPDGRELAFVSDRDGSPQAWVMELATGEARMLTSGPLVAARPAFSGGGDRLAYLATGAGAAGTSLRVVPAAGGAPRELAAGLVSPGTPAWSPGDTHVAVIDLEGGVTRLLLHPADGGPGLRRVTLAEGAVGPGVNEAQWSADGRRLLVASAAGVRTLPVLEGGLVGADWTALANTPAQAARWVPGTGDALLTDADGLARAGAGGTARIPLPLSWRAAPAAGRLVVRASRVFDGTSDQYLHDHDVIIEGERIVAVQPRSPAEPAPGSVLVDATGRTVLPGLVDLSLALAEGAGERLGRQLLAFGITTAQVTDSGGSALREVAERWDARAAGPRLLRYADLCGPAGLVEADPVPLGAARVCAGAGPALPALLASLPPPRPAAWSPHWLAVTTGLVQAIEPRSAPGGRALPAALTGRDLLYQDAVDVVVHSGATLVTDLATTALPVLVDRHPGLLDAFAWNALLPEDEREAQADAWRARRARDGEGLTAWLRDNQRVLGRVIAGGGRLAAASGSPLTPYGLGLHAELRALEGAGLPRAAVLRAATAEAARTLGLQEQIGTLQPGRLADLLVVDGDPLADLQALLRIDTVVTGGRVRPRSSLAPDPALRKFTPPPAANPAKPAKRRR